MPTTYLNGTKEQFMAFMSLPVNGPVRMLNLLKFKTKVEGSDQTGADAYQAYLIAAQPFFQQSNAKIIFMGTPQFSLIGPQDLEWDKVLIVEYATKEDFLSMVTAENYPSALRSAALKDSRLIFCS